MYSEISPPRSTKPENKTPSVQSASGKRFVPSPSSRQPHSSQRKHFGYTTSIPSWAHCEVTNDLETRSSNTALNERDDFHQKHPIHARNSSISLLESSDDYDFFSRFTPQPQRSQRKHFLRSESESELSECTSLSSFQVPQSARSISSNSSAPFATDSDIVCQTQRFRAQTPRRVDSLSSILDQSPHIVNSSTSAPIDLALNLSPQTYSKGNINVSQNLAVVHDRVTCKLRMRFKSLHQAFRMLIRLVRTSGTENHSSIVSLDEARCILYEVDSTLRLPERESGVWELLQLLVAISNNQAKAEDRESNFVTFEGFNKVFSVEPGKPPLPHDWNPLPCPQKVTQPTIPTDFPVKPQTNQTEINTQENLSLVEDFSSLKHNRLVTEQSQANPLLSHPTNSIEGSQVNEEMWFNMPLQLDQGVLRKPISPGTQSSHVVESPLKSTICTSQQTAPSQDENIAPNFIKNMFTPQVRKQPFEKCESVSESSFSPRDSFISPIRPPPVVHIDPIKKPPLVETNRPLTAEPGANVGSFTQPEVGFPPSGRYSPQFAIPSKSENLTNPRPTTIPTPIFTKPITDPPQRVSPNMGNCRPQSTFCTEIPGQAQVQAQNRVGSLAPPLLTFDKLAASYNNKPNYTRNLSTLSSSENAARLAHAAMQAYSSGIARKR